MGLMSNGVKHWVFQRAANALIVVFAIAMVVTLVSGVTYESLQSLMGNALVKVYLLVTLVVVLINSVLAAWQIAGDYAKKFNISATLIVGFCVIVSAVYLIVGFSVIF